MFYCQLVLFFVLESDEVTDSSNKKQVIFRWVDSCLKAPEVFIRLHCVLDITDTVVNTLERN